MDTKSIVLVIDTSIDQHGNACVQFDQLSTNHFSNIFKNQSLGKFDHFGKDHQFELEMNQSNEIGTVDKVTKDQGGGSADVSANDRRSGNGVKNPLN